MNGHRRAGDRYRDLGIRSNPFIAQDRGGGSTTPLFPFVDRGIPAPPPPGSKTLVQVIGESGHGKSTHLREWRGRAPGPYHYIPRHPYSDRWTAPPTGPLVYGDEIDRMPIPLRRRWFRRLARDGSTLVIGTHVDLTRVGQKVGFDVVTHELQPMSENELRTLIDLRLTEVSVDGSLPTVLFDDAEIQLVHARSGGIPLEAETLCHELLAARALGGSITS